MNSVTPNNSKRRTVRDFSRRNFVLFYLVLLLVPTAYFVWYLCGTASGALPPALDLHLPQGAVDSGGQMAFYSHILQTCWKATVKMVPYSIGQYLLGMPCDIDQYFIWASGSLLSIALLSMVQVFDVLLNTELNGTGKSIWIALMAVFSAFGAPIPQLIYWFQYMWMEPDKSDTSDTPTPSAVSA